MQRYQIIGKAGAGSLIAEFLLREAGQEYDVTFLSREEIAQPELRRLNPLGKIPVLIRPDGETIFETLAITAHLIEAFPHLAPPVGSVMRDRHWQYLAMLATHIYPAYHRQHHTRYYVPEAGFDDVRAMALAAQQPAYDYIEGLLTPFLCGSEMTAADFYLYMLTRWDLNRDALVADRPKLSAFITIMRAHPSVDAVISTQKRA